MGYTKTGGGLTQGATLSSIDFIWNNPGNGLPDPWAFLPPVLTAASEALAGRGPAAAAPVAGADAIFADGEMATDAAAPSGGTASSPSGMLGAGSDASISQTALDPLGAPVLNTGSAGTSGLVINITYENSAALPAGFTTAVNAAVQYLESKISNAITLNFEIGFGVYKSTLAVPSGYLAITSPNIFAKTYSSVRTALAAHATSTDDQTAIATLPTGSTDPTHSTSNGINVATAQQRALGMLAANSSSIDAYVGLSSTFNFTYDPNNRAVAGAYDAIGVLEHEMTEGMGRVSEPTFHSILDLFRYSGAGVRAVTGTSPGTLTAGYLSLDKGTTELAPFDSSGGDLGDWSPGNTLFPQNSGTMDSFAGTALPGNLLAISATDLREMDVIGFDIACFAAGSRIAAERGDVPVEELQVGERVYTRFGGLKPIRWIGQRTLDCTRHPDPDSVQPIRIAAEAFASGTPVRPLFLSPEHAVQSGDALVPIRLLLNGGSVAQQHGTARVQYWHVELDRHDLLFAEGLAAESYLDTGNRGMFANASGPVQLHPGMAGAQAQRETESCLPLLLDPDRLEPVWRALAERSRQLGFASPEPPATTTDPGLHLIVRGRRIEPVARNAGRCWFVLPDFGAGARLMSRSVVPSALRPWLDDRRRLGVMLHGIILHTTQGPLALALDDPRLDDGWWAPEGDYPTLWRWTDGDAALPPIPGCRMLELRLGAPLAYPLAGTAPAMQHRRVA